MHPQVKHMETDFSYVILKYMSIEILLISLSVRIWTWKAPLGICKQSTGKTVWVFKTVWVVFIGFMGCK
jgi:hypothetical protein